MSWLHYQSTKASAKPFVDSCSSYAPPSYSPRFKAPESYRNGGYCTGWRTTEFQGSKGESPAAARGDPGYGESGLSSHATRMTIHSNQLSYGRDPKPVDPVILEKMQTKLKFLEDSNIVMQTRNQNLLTENKALQSRLEEGNDEVKRLEQRLASMREELDLEKSKLDDARAKLEEAEKKKPIATETVATSTNVASKSDRGVQLWAVCSACQRKLESCEKQPPTVTITKSELEVLEKDMQTLRDTIIAREEAWDKAMEREQNYRQQLTRLTTETITARHLSETRQDELKTLASLLSERESELKSVQKDKLYLNQLIAKMYNSQQREQEGGQRGNLGGDINEKDQRFIEEVARRVSSGKCRQRPKPKSFCTEKNAHTGSYQSSPRDKSSRATKDQVGYSRDSKR